MSPANEAPVRQHRRARAEHACRSTSAAAATSRCARRCDDPRGDARQTHGLGHPRPRRRRLPDGAQDLVPAARRHGQVPGLQRRRVRAGHVQGPRADAEEPAHAHRGDRDRGLRGQDLARSSTSAASTQLQADILEAAIAEAAAGRLRRRGHPRLGALALAGAAPRRRRLHLRRGDRPARLAGGQARQPAPEAAVPGDRGPLRRPDADQQRRDARDRPAHHPHGRRGVRQARHRDARPAPSWCRSPATSAPGQLRDRARDPVARDHLRPRRRAAERSARSSSGSRAARAPRS